MCGKQRERNRTVVSSERDRCEGEVLRGGVGAVLQGSALRGEGVAGGRCNGRWKWRSDTRTAEHGGEHCLAWEGKE